MNRATLTTFEAGRYCNVSPYTIRHWVNRGLLPAYTTPGGHRRIRREDLDDFLARYGMPGEEELLSAPRRMLLLEADPRVRRTHAALLSGLSRELEVRAPEDPFSAGALLHSFQPQLVFFDLDDPRLDWRAAFRMLKRTKEYGPVRAVGLTKKVTVSTAEEAELVGLSGVLLKPLDAEAARGVLKEVFPYLKLVGKKTPRRAKATPVKRTRDEGRETRR